ncbi:Uncharacterized protein BP5553_01804 [Venustampulla echinocandica]|uniref:NAD(P)-binding domain-containing protein n=1 Tax=Venustampulla echinocandica TaxID=2656787 RepID=A0A370U243_9HELO|nr:Uncharacterized protein BP5553_01804 [Venustampulla echinocandica]RDL41825.1 Uncharacterized protein BP5553_01804 [Venustampulla echinocandica]
MNHQIKAMKLIVTGCTGFIGAEVLSQCLANPSITSVIALSRRELPDAVGDNPKLKVVIMKDFNSYSDSVLKQLSGADACIWCMGTTAGDKALEIDYPLAFGNAMSKTLPESKKKFRHVHLSGALTERNQERSLWFLGNMRKVKGAGETTMLSFANKSETGGMWETLIVKAGFVTNVQPKGLRDVIGPRISSSIRVDELAATLMDAAMNGREVDTIDDNMAMVEKGRALLSKAT